MPTPSRSSLRRAGTAPSEDQQALSADTQLIEFVCRDKSAEHYVGASGIPDRVLKEQEAQKATPPAGR